MNNIEFLKSYRNPEIYSGLLQMSKGELIHIIVTQQEDLNHVEQEAKLLRKKVKLYNL